MYVTYLFRELRRRYRQAILVSLGLALGVCLVVVVSATSLGVRDAQNEVLHGLYGIGTDITVAKDAPSSSSGSLRLGMEALSEGKAGETFTKERLVPTPGWELVSETEVVTMSDLEGVSSSAGGLMLTALQISGTYTDSATFSGGGSGSGSGAGSGTPPPIDVTSFSVAGVDVRDQTLGPMSSANVAEGRAFSADEADATVAVVDAGYAKQHALALGDTLTIDGKAFSIIGISESATPPANVYIPLEQAQDLADAAEQLNQMYVRADSSDQIAQVEEEIIKAVPDVTVTTAQNLADQVNGSLTSASSLAETFGKWLAIAALVAAVAVASLLTLSGVSRRVREFGTLKAIGWRSRRIVAQVMGEAFVQGILGGALGAGLGYSVTVAIARLTPALQATTALTGSGQPGSTGGGGRLAAVAPTVTVPLEAPVTLGLLALAIGLALAGALIAGGIGGWRAARLSPAVALRRVD